MYVTKDNVTLLPVSVDPEDGCNESEQNARGRYCFTAGDARANENLYLTAIHFIAARQHNYLVDKLTEMNPNYDDETLYQEARRILGAQFQHITYNEFLPLLLGNKSSEMLGIPSQTSSRVEIYDETLEPTLANVFVAGKLYNFFNYHDSNDPISSGLQIRPHFAAWPLKKGEGSNQHRIDKSSRFTLQSLLPLPC